MLMDTPRRLAHAPRSITKTTTTPTPCVPPLPEGGAYVKCVEWDNYHIECFPGERYEKTTQLEGVSLDVFVTKNKLKELEKHEDFEIYYLKKKSSATATVVPSPITTICNYGGDGKLIQQIGPEECRKSKVYWGRLYEATSSE
jgi:hypothetical protein